MIGDGNAVHVELCGTLNNPFECGVPIEQTILGVDV
jgi:hypothetical protein